MFSFAVGVGVLLGLVLVSHLSTNAFPVFKAAEFAILWKARDMVLFTGSNFGKEKMFRSVAGLVTG